MDRARRDLQVPPPHRGRAVGELERAVQIHHGDVVGVVLVCERAVAAVVVAADEEELDGDRGVSVGYGLRRRGERKVCVLLTPFVVSVKALAATS